MLGLLDFFPLGLQVNHPPQKSLTERQNSHKLQPGSSGKTKQFHAYLVKVALKQLPWAWESRSSVPFISFYIGLAMAKAQIEIR